MTEKVNKTIEDLDMGGVHRLLMDLMADARKQVWYLKFLLVTVFCALILVFTYSQWSLYHLGVKHQTIVQEMVQEHDKRLNEILSEYDFSTSVETNTDGSDGGNAINYGGNIQR